MSGDPFSGRGRNEANTLRKGTYNAECKEFISNIDFQVGVNAHFEPPPAHA